MKNRTKNLLRIVDITGFYIGFFSVAIGSILLSTICLSIITGIEMEIPYKTCVDCEGNLITAYTIFPQIDYLTGSLFLLIIGLVIIIAILDKYNWKTEKKEK